MKTYKLNHTDQGKSQTFHFIPVNDVTVRVRRYKAGKVEIVDKGYRDARKLWAFLIQLGFKRV